jgi:hypothetical protein
VTLFPVPLRPRMQHTAPWGTSKDTLSNTCLSPNAFDTPSNRIAEVSAFTMRHSEK